MCNGKFCRQSSCCIKNDNATYSFQDKSALNRIATFLQIFYTLLNNRASYHHLDLANDPAKGKQRPIDSHAWSAKVHSASLCTRSRPQLLNYVHHHIFNDKN